MHRRLRLALWSAIPLIAAAAWLAWWSQPAVQAPRVFADLVRGLAGDAGLVLGRIHPDYDWPAHWPALFERREALAVLLPGDGASDRDLARRGLAQAVFIGRDDPMRLSWRIARMEELADGRVRVAVDLGVTGRFGRIDPPRQGIGFTLARDGWFGRLAIVAHDRLDDAINRP